MCQKKGPLFGALRVRVYVGMPFHTWSNTKTIGTFEARALVVVIVAWRFWGSPKRAIVSTYPVLVPGRTYKYMCDFDKRAQVDPYRAGGEAGGLL